MEKLNKIIVLTTLFSSFLVVPQPQKVAAEIEEDPNKYNNLYAYEIHNPIYGEEEKQIYIDFLDMVERIDDMNSEIWLNVRPFGYFYYEEQMNYGTKTLQQANNISFNESSDEPEYINDYDTEAYICYFITNISWQEILEYTENPPYTYSPWNDYSAETILEPVEFIDIYFGGTSDPLITLKDLMYISQFENDEAVYNEAYELGADEGYQIGYSEGVESGDPSIINQGISETLTFITKGLNDTLNLKVLGNITIGNIIFLPILAGLLFLLFKLFGG